jgi:hypothetical protein
MPDEDHWYARSQRPTFERPRPEQRRDEHLDRENAPHDDPARRHAGAGYADRGYGEPVRTFYEDDGGYQGGPAGAGPGLSRWARGALDYRPDDADLRRDVQDRDPAPRGYHDPRPDYREPRSFRVPSAEDHRGQGPKGYRRSDPRIHEDVNDRLTDDPMIDATNVEVLVRNGEVTLNGTVASRFAKRRAEDVAESVSGVTHLQNNLRVATQAAGTVGATTDPRIAAVSEGKDADAAAKDYSG